MTPTEAAVDGRRARREQGRHAVIDAMVDLLLEGHTPPTASEIAVRAGVSVASVFRYFDDLADLQRQTIARYLERHEALFDVPGIGEGDLDERISRLVTARTALYETIAPVARYVRVRSFDLPELAQNLGQVRDQMADQVHRHFRPELDARPPAAAEDLTATIVALTSFESWDLFRGELDRGPAQVRRAWRDALRALLAAGGAPAS